MQRKAEQKKVSACCPESGISDTLKESSAAGEAGPAAGFCKMRESAHEKKPATCLEILEALKGDAPPDQGVIRADRACRMLNCCKKWHKKEDACGVGSTQGTAPAAGPLDRAKVCSKKRPVVPDRNGSPDVTL